MKRGLEVSVSVTQGGSRCAPLPWATLSLPLRDGRWSLLMSDDNMRFISTISLKIAEANAGERLGFAGKSRVIIRHQPGVAQFHP